MKSAICFIVGLLVAMGAVGTMDVDPNANVIVQTFVALAGLGIMGAGVNWMKEFK